MVRLINFNTITYSIAMNKNTGAESLAQEFAFLPQAMEAIELSDGVPPLVLARIVRGLSSEEWSRACDAYPLSHWHAFQLASEHEPEEDLDCMAGPAAQALPITPFREIHGVLTRTMFLRLLNREIIRLGRQGGAMSLIGASLANRKDVATALGNPTLKRLDALLGLTLLSRLEECDAIGLAREGVFVCSLPGIGQLAARRFAETASSAFADAARPFFPAGGLGAGQKCGCAMGIVNILPGETCTAPDLLKRARNTLDVALRKEGAQIHQETAMTPLEGTTLVHSSEKRFLFFGGDPK